MDPPDLEWDGVELSYLAWDGTSSGHFWTRFWTLMQEISWHSIKFGDPCNSSIFAGVQIMKLLNIHPCTLTDSNTFSSLSSAVSFLSLMWLFNTHGHRNNQGSRSFQKIYVPFQNSMEQKSGMRQVSYWGPTNIGHSCTEVSRPCFLPPPPPPSNKFTFALLCSSYFYIREGENCETNDNRDCGNTRIST
jgi:hypothetical protein